MKLNKEREICLGDSVLTSEQMDADNDDDDL